MATIFVYFFIFSEFCVFMNLEYLYHEREVRVDELPMSYIVLGKMGKNKLKAIACYTELFSSKVLCGFWVCIFVIIMCFISILDGQYVCGWGAE